MTRMIWNRQGHRFYEHGVDRGVMYPIGGKGVPWNGLISVDENPVEGVVARHYLDGVTYHQSATRPEFQASLEAYTYPDELNEMVGSHSNGFGLYFEQQEKREFNLSYRTHVGNDIEGGDLGYKIHIVYYAIATPTQSSFGTNTSTVDPSLFTWDLSTRVVKNVGPRSPLSHIIIDSTSTHSSVLKQVEDILYGTSTKDPRCPGVVELTDIFAQTAGFNIFERTGTGMAPLVETEGPADLMSVDKYRTGLYERPRNSRLMRAEPGLYILE